MLRHKSMVPLSRQHQHALALCVRIDRASPIPESDANAWQMEIAQQFHAEIRIHFAAEEQCLFPAAREFAQLDSLVKELLCDHEKLREFFAKAEVQQLSGSEITEFARILSEHIRKEERQLFEHLQQLMSREALACLGLELEHALKGAEQACVLPAKNRRKG